MHRIAFKWLKRFKHNKRIINHRKDRENLAAKSHHRTERRKETQPRLNKYGRYNRFIFGPH